MKTLIAMSGGVDSSVAALLMKEDERIGCTMRLFDADPSIVTSERACCSLDDVDDAKAVCRRLGIPHYVFNFKDDFEEKIIKKFVRSYENGMTPNPCIDCNRYLKFEKLVQRAKELGCERVVTGHYARVEEADGAFVLKKAKDPAKDQSYVLYTLTREQLQLIRFPLGELSKDEVRAIAEENGFVNAKKPDSQDICFIPDGDYAAFIERYTNNPDFGKGNFVSPDGTVLGQHRGITHYTIGQRKHLGIALGKPIFVSDIDSETGDVTLADEDALFSTEALVKDFNWISGVVPTDPVRCAVKTRYRQTEQPATIFPLDDECVRIVFDAPVRAITPGQAAVAYDGEIVLGGGVIVKERI